MSFFVSEPQGVYEPIPNGSYPAICYLIADIGEHWQEPMEKGKEGRWQRQIVIGWEVQNVKEDEPDKVYYIHSFYSASLGKNSNLRRDLANWRGKEFTPEELQNFDLRNVLRAPCLLQIASKTKKDGTQRDAVTGIGKLPRGMQALPPKQEFLFDIEQDLDRLEEMPKIVQTCVKTSRQMQEMNATVSDPASFDGDPFEEEPPFEAPFADPFGGY